MFLVEISGTASIRLFQSGLRRRSKGIFLPLTRKARPDVSGNGFDLLGRVAVLEKAGKSSFPAVPRPVQQFPIFISPYFPQSLQHLCSVREWLME